MKIGLYGGTFDPPHNAHLELAEWVQKELQLDFVYFVPAAIHAFKNNMDLSPPEVRLQLVEDAIKDHTRLRVSRIELDRPDVSYTVHTLQEFRQYEKLPDSELVYIMGFDNLAEFHRWRDPEEILNLAKVVVIRRSADNIPVVSTDIEKKVHYLESPIINISSTEIRNKIRRGIDVSTLVPPPVLSLINQYGLYRQHT
jgi:nicotinate-nucleotide adenylyltransferase